MKTAATSPHSSGVRLLGLVATLAAGLATLVGHGGSSDGGDAFSQNCTPAVSAGFSGNADWLVSDGSAGGRADGRGGVAIGVMMSSGPVVGATVTVRTGDDQPIGSAVTGQDGRVTLNPCNTAGPFLVEAIGGSGASYRDEAIGAEGGAVAFGPEMMLRSAVAEITGNIGVTPFSEAAVQRRLATSPGTPPPATPPSVAAQIAAANTEARRMLATVLPAALLPEDVTRLPAVGGAGSTPLPDTPAGRLTVALAALGRHASIFNPSASAPGWAAGQQFARDASDGVINGVDATAAPVAAAAGGRAYDPAQLNQGLTMAARLVAERHAQASLQSKLDTVARLGVMALPSAGASTPTVARLRSTGAVSVLNAEGAEASQLAADVVDLWSASQPPASTLILRRRDGGLQAVGDNGAAGRFGNGTVTSSATPLPLTGLPSASAVSVGANHVLARLADGSVSGWGASDSGQLAGLAATLIPQPLPAVTDVVSVLALGNLSFAVRNDGGLLAWGQGAQALGAGSATTSTRPQPGPVLIAAGQPLTGVVAIAGYLAVGADEPVVAAVRHDGTVWTWGSNSTGGLGVAGGARGFAAAVGGLAGIVKVAATGNGFLAIDRNGGVMFWGSTTLAGTGAAGVQHLPTALAGLPPIFDVGNGFPGLFQARLLDGEGVRWRADGLGAEPVAGGNELESSAPVTRTTMIDLVAGDDRINAAERNAGVTVSGTVSEAGNPVTVQVGNATRTVTPAGTTWQVQFATTDIPASGTVEFTASYTTPLGQSSNVARRAVTIDTQAPTVSFVQGPLRIDLPADKDSAGKASLVSLVQLNWGEAVNDFIASDIVISNGPEARLGNLEPQAAVGTGVWLARVPVRLSGPRQMTPTITIAAGAVTDASGNGNAEVTYTIPGDTFGSDDQSAVGDGSGGNGGDSGGTSDGGSPGDSPKTFLVKASSSDGRLTLSWQEAEPASDNLPVLFYLVIVRDRDAGDTRVEELAHRKPRFYRTPIIATGIADHEYKVSLPASANQVYRIRACNAAPSNADVLITGFTGCRDSHEFNHNAKIATYTGGDPAVLRAFCPDERAISGVFSPATAPYLAYGENVTGACGFLPDATNR